MTGTRVRILLVADTHLGFDLPFRPRIQRRRRGHEFFANFDRALAPAREGRVDLVVHGGDLLYRTRVPPALVEMALAPLVRVAQQGIPVYLVPGNHERSRIQLQLWLVHPNLHIFDQPKTYLCNLPHARVALSGFPFSRQVAGRFRDLVAQTGWDQVRADARMLCLHQTVEGAQVGKVNYTFRSGADVVRGEDIPGGFVAVLAGHIHRNQILTHDLGGRSMAAPVVYPGSVERTSFAERDEGKHYAVIEIEPTDDGAGRLMEVSFVPLPARPMVDLIVEGGGLGAKALSRRIREQLATLDPDSVVRIEVTGRVLPEAGQVLRAENLRALAPPSMNITQKFVRTNA